VTVARFEAGTDQDVRVGTLSKVVEALGLELAAVPAGRAGAGDRLLAREQERLRRLDLRMRHAALAVRLLAAGPAESAALVRRARERVDVWERNRLCSEHYISRWRTLLRAPLPRLARALVAHDEWTDALLQNSPWAFALEAAP
jgi:hypothetical protein